MKTFLKVAAVVLIAVPLIGYGYLTYNTRARNAAPTEVAVAALVADDAVRIESGDWLVMRPSDARPRAGFILYPGANCDIRGYAPLLHEIAARGYLVVAVSMPFDFAIFAPNRADEVRAAFPEIGQWVIGGHSMGGAMAARYASLHENSLAGLILWDSYPPEANSLAQSHLPIVNIHRATLDGEPPEKFAAQRFLYPDSSVWVPVPGGNHMQFGSFDGGGYVEEWDAKISPEAQHAIIVAATIAGLDRMTGG